MQDKNIDIFTFNDLRNNLNLIKISSNWAAVKYDTYVLFVEILGSGEERKKIVINDSLNTKFLYKSESISWLTCEKIQSLDHVSVILDTLNKLQF